MKKQTVIISLAVALFLINTPTQAEVSEPTIQYGYATKEVTHIEVETKTYYDVPLSEETQDFLMMKCEEYEVPVELALGLISVESTFNPTLISSTNDYGLMQVNKINHDRVLTMLDKHDIMDIETNIEAGLIILSEALEKGDNIHTSLMVYNQGYAGAKRSWAKGVYSTKYSMKVVNAMEGFNEQL